MKEILYYAPQNLRQALDLLAKHKEKVTVLAGGTDLVPMINDYQLRPDILLYVGHLGLDYIKREKGKLAIGATTPWNKLESNSMIAQKYGALKQATQISSCAAVKTRGTIGGNLGTASQAADLVTPLLAMDAEVCLVKKGGKRLVPIKDFFLGPGKTIRKPDELIVEIQLPLKKGTSVFLKLGRRKAMTLSVANVAVRVEMAGAICRDARIALGAMAPKPIRCLKAEGLLKGKKIEPALISQCAFEAVATSKPIDDGRATAWYRKQVAAVLVSRALTQACGIAP